MKHLIKKFTAAILSAAMFMGSVGTYAVFETAVVYADTLELTAQDSAEGTNVTVANGKNVEIRFASAQYTTFADVLNAGYTTLNINYNVTSYTPLSGETAGVMPFVTYGEAWQHGNVWKNLSDGTSGTLSLDLSQFASSSEAVKFGVQIANITGTVSYSVSAHLSGGSGGNGGGTSAKLENTIDMTNNDVEMNYAKLLQESLYFYDANMCGTDVDENSEFSWREDCHVLDEKVTWNGMTVDVSGGYHDAGDHVKFGLPAAYAASVLGLAYYEYKDVFDELGQTEHYKRIMDRFADYFERCTVLDDSGNVLTFCYQVGSGGTDHSYNARPEDQESAQGQRPAYFTSDDAPCTDVVSETAAALAIYSMNFNDAKALEYAEALFAYAQGHEKSNGADGMWGFYNSSSWADDYALAASMLYRATKNEKYKTAYYENGSDVYSCGWPVCWDNVKTLANLYSPSGKPQNTDLPAYIKKAASEKKKWDGYVCMDEWASLKYNVGLQFLGLAYDKQTSSDIFSDWSKGQMSYLLGNNNGNSGNGYCFAVGYNNKSVKYPHHRAVYNSAGFANNAGEPKHLLLGALVGGPKETASGFTDDVAQYEYTEVGLDYNAPLVAAAAAHYYYVKNNGTDEEKAVQQTIDITKVSGIELRSLSAKVTTADILRCILGEISLDKTVADLNNDGEIDIKD
ncbi:MAG: glycoside hydrolase family 9 protein, partial [Firmicutes bacterium]|nr:glycoside hydrolase family 9 protein [Bacillota bacterium]